MRRNNSCYPVKSPLGLYLTNPQVNGSSHSLVYHLRCKYRVFLCKHKTFIELFFLQLECRLICCLNLSHVFFALVGYHGNDRIAALISGLLALCKLHI